MPDEAPVFPVSLNLKQPFPETVDCGAPFTFTIVVETDSGCDLSGAPFRVTNESGETVCSGELPPIVRITPESDAYDPRHGPVDMRDAAEITVTAPAQVGTFTWTFTLPEHLIEKTRHEEARLLLKFMTKEHATSLAVWDNPTPVTIGSRFSFKVGAKCTADCPLMGETVDILNSHDAVVAQVVLSEAPWQGTRGLYWATAEAPAPSELGQFQWSARMAMSKRGLPHGKSSSASFSFVTMNPPQHHVAIEIVEQGTGTPVPNAQVRLGPCRAATDEAGSVRFQVPGGDFRVMIWKKNHQASEQILRIDRDLTLRIEAKVVPEEDPYSRYWRD